MFEMKENMGPLATFIDAIYFAKLKLITWGEFSTDLLITKPKLLALLKMQRNLTSARTLHSKFI